MSKFLKISILSISIILLFNYSAVSQRDTSFVEIQKTLSTTITIGDQNNGYLSEPLRSITSKVPGVMVGKKGSDPSTFSTAVIRGRMNPFSSVEPLYIVDGVWGVDPSNISADDIQSFEIIRDIAATIPYGSSGANGVILISTKGAPQGKKINIDFSSQIALNTLTRKYNVLDASQYRETTDELFPYAVDGGSETDWQDEIFRNTFSQTYNLTVSGTVNNTAYKASVLFMNVPGLINGTERKQSGGNLLISQKALKGRLSLSLSGAYGMQEASLFSYDGDLGLNVLYNALIFNPTDPVYNTDGTYAQPRRSFKYSNPLALIENIDNKSSLRNSRIGFNGSYSLTGYLSAGVRIGYQRSNTTLKYHQSKNALPYFSYAIDNNNQINKERLNITPYMEFKRTFTNKNNLQASLGYTYYLNVDHSESEFHNDYLNIKNSSAYQQKFNNVYTSFLYEYNNRYFTELNASFEGQAYYSEPNDSTRYQPVKYNVFNYSLLAGWKLHNETFLSGASGINKLILKLAYGKNTTMPFGTLLYRYEQDVFAPEIYNEISPSVDFSIFKNRLSGSIGYYYRFSDNILGYFAQPIPPNLTPYGLTNQAKTKNSGVEISLSAIAINKSKMKWIPAMSFWTNNMDYTGDQYLMHMGYLATGNAGYENYTQVLSSGNPAVNFYLPAHTGQYYQGSPLYESVSGNYTDNLGSAKRVREEQIIPSWELGFQNTLQVFEGIDITLNLRAVGGHSIYNATRMMLSTPELLPEQNVLQEAVSNYSNGQRLRELSNLYLEDATYLRIEDLTAGYTFSNLFSARKGSLRLYAGAANLFTLTNYSGSDPAPDVSNNETGIDEFNVYPLARTYYLGLKLKL